MTTTTSGWHCQIVRLGLPFAPAMAIFTAPAATAETPAQRRFLTDLPNRQFATDADALLAHCEANGRELGGEQAGARLMADPSMIDQRRALIAAQFRRRGCDIATAVDFPETSAHIQTRSEAAFFNYIASIEETGTPPNTHADGDTTPLPVVVHTLDPFKDRRQLQVRTLTFAEMIDAKSGEKVRGISLQTVDYFWEVYPNYIESHITYFTNEVQDFKSYYKKETIKETSIGFSVGIGAASSSLDNESDIKHDEPVFDHGKEKNEPEPDPDTGGSDPDKTEPDVWKLAAGISFGLKFASRKARLIEKEINDYKKTVGAVSRETVTQIGQVPAELALPAQETTA